MKAAAFGEILWDVFPDGTKTMGGAPLNVASHISRLGGDACIISAVGNDELGDASLEKVRAAKVSDEYIVRREEATGVAEVVLVDGIPGYAFNHPAAWDRIILPESKLESLTSEQYDVFIFGTLAQRDEDSRKSLFEILERIKARECFLDVNLRLSFYSDEIIRSSLEKATILKLNDEEAPVILKASACSSLDELMNRYELKIVILTCGKKGTYCHLKDGTVFHKPPKNVPVVDTVGAGDSVSAAFLYFYLCGESAEQALYKAGDLADYVVQHSGAVPEYDEDIKSQLGIK